MIIKNIVQKNSYYDSATLMLLSSQVAKEVGPDGDAAVMMGSDMNREILEKSGLLADEGRAAGPNDLIFAFRAATEAEADAAYTAAQETLNSRSAKMRSEENVMAHSVEEAAERAEGAKMAVVSLPGQYAAREVKKLLKADCHVLLFSDNVSLQDEIALKKLAVERGLLMMGPDCGTAVVNGVGLGFANTLRRGPIGIAAGSGTGLQEVMTLIHNYGGGISQALGTGGRDLSGAVGGLMMEQCIRLLAEDPKTEIVVVISKPPEKPVADRMMAQLAGIGKPAVVCFLGGDQEEVIGNIHVVRTLEDTACEALALAGVAGNPLKAAYESLPDIAETCRTKLADSQKYVRGLFCGGTLAYEAMLILSDRLGGIHSNISHDPDLLIAGTDASVAHTVLDLGDDAFTVGRPHPMIEPALRAERLVQEALDPETAVVLIDVETGYGSHEDPAGVAAEEITEARKKLAEAGRDVVFVCSVCGSVDDFQGYAAQEDKLRSAGAVVLESNAQASTLAALIAR